MGKRRTLRMDVETKMIAKAMTINCVRNTIIEHYHQQGRLSDADMKAFNKVVVNRIYTFLDCIHNRSEREKTLFLWKMVCISERFTGNWDELEFDGDIWPGEKAFLEEMRQIQRMKKEVPASMAKKQAPGQSLRSTAPRPPLRPLVRPTIA